MFLKAYASPNISISFSSFVSFNFIISKNVVSIFLASSFVLSLSISDIIFADASDIAQPLPVKLISCILELSSFIFTNILSSSPQLGFIPSFSIPFISFLCVLSLVFSIIIFLYISTNSSLLNFN